MVKQREKGLEIYSSISRIPTDLIDVSTLHQRQSVYCSVL